MDFCIDELTALVAPPGDSEKLYSNLQRLIRDPALRGRLSEYGLKKAKEFTWQRSVDMLEKILLTSTAGGPAYIEISDASHVCASGHKGAALLVWDVDPFSGYDEWSHFKSTVDGMEREGFDLDVMLYIDRHSSRSVRAWIKMLLPKRSFKNISWFTFYHKKIRIDAGFLGKLMFSIFVAVKISCRYIFCRKKYPKILWRTKNIPENA